MHIDTALEGDTEMMKQLYSLFFAWKTDADEKADAAALAAVVNMSEEEKTKNDEKAKEEKR